MAALSFQPFIDKENTSVVNPQTSKARGLGIRGPGEKVFTSGSQSLTTPRRALGDVKNTLLIGSSIKPTAQKGGLKDPELKPCNPFAGVLGSKTQHLGLNKLPNGVNKKKSVEVNKRPTLTQPAVKKSLVPKKPEVFDDEKEEMFIYKEPEDDFEDIIPKSKRINTYILDKMLSWRLPCVSGTLSDDEEDEDRRMEEEARREQQEFMSNIEAECERLEREAEEKRRQEEELILGSAGEIELPYVELSLLEVSP